MGSKFVIDLFTWFSSAKGSVLLKSKGIYYFSALLCLLPTSVTRLVLKFEIFEFLVFSGEMYFGWEIVAKDL